MTSFLITGCAGFIGSHLTEHLLSIGHQVIGIDNFDKFYNRNIKENNLLNSLQNPEFKFLEFDITDNNYWNKLIFKPDIVIHLAAKAGVRPSIADPQGYIETNIIGTQLLLEWMKKNDVKNLVFAGSSSVYGNNKKIPFSEDDNVNFPISPYAYTKKACEQIIYTYHYLYDISAITLRFFTVYGPRQRPDLAIYKFTNLLYGNQPITIYGDGTNARDYTYIDDIISGITKTISLFKKNETNPFYEIINLGNNKPVKLLELIELLKKVSSKELEVKHLPMQPGDVDITFADISKAQRLLGYTPKTIFKEGLEKFINWFVNNRL